MTALTIMQLRAFRAAWRAAKRDSYARAVGGFAVYLMTDGTIDWFPVGQVPNRLGEPDRGAVLLGRWRWNHQRWSRVG